MAVPLAVSPFLAGDPIRLGPEISSLAELVAALDDPSLASPGLLEVAPGVALIHSLTGDGERPLGTGDLLALHSRVQYRAAVVFRLGSPACPAARHAPPGGGAEVAASNRRTTEDRLMTTLGLHRKVIEDPVETVMTRQVVLILEDIPMSEVRAISAQYDYNGFPVVTQAGRLVGVII